MDSRTDEDLPLLTFKQVKECGCAAFYLPTFDEGFLARSRLYVEYRYEDGEVWAVTRDLDHVHSMRRAYSEETPEDGWKHRPHCECRHHRAA